MKQTLLVPKDIQDAKLMQKELAARVLLEDELPENVEKIAGVDVSNTPFDPQKMVFGSIVILSYPALTVEKTVSKANREDFPYVPGLLGFREVPTLIQAYQELTEKPDLIFVDGHGISHPRKFGVATHLGVLLDIPTIGVAKSILVGKPDSSLSEEVGAQVSLKWKGEEIGVCIRTKRRSNPLIVSPGHKISLKTAVEWVLRCLKGYRLPEPTRQAHMAANICRNIFLKNL